MFFDTAATVALCAATLVAAVPAGPPSGGPGGYGGSSFSWGGKTPLRGMNLGGWLVLEPWITPSIFQQYDISRGIVDEYTLNEALGNETALNTIFKPHWDSWITLTDFQNIAKAGFNLVRVPVGFWAYDTFGTPYASGSAPYVDKAIDWARQTGLKVLIDLHGAPGSQNGFDNSGQRTKTPSWGQGDTVDETLQVLKTISEKYGDSSYDDVVAGIELLNEPLTSSVGLDTTKQFERDGYGKLRETSQSRVAVIHDGFEPPSSYNGWLTPSDGGEWVALDHHEYQVFNNEQVAFQPWQHRQYVCNNAASYSGADKWSFVGEWTAAMTDCAAALNGYGIGARYDGTYPNSTYHGSCESINFIETWSQQLKEDTRGYIEAQLEVFEHYTNGWIFWTWKTEASPEWDAQRLINAGVFPQPLTDRQFGMVCQY